MTLPRLRPSLFLADAARRARVYVGLSQLRDAWDGARDLGVPRQAFAVEVFQLYAAGLTNTDLRWLLARGYVEHLREGPAADGGGRSLVPSMSSSITPSSCFVPTAAGLEAWAGWHKEGGLPEPSGPKGVGGAATWPLPLWEGALHRLSWQGVLVKQFRAPAANQELILATFQELGWPEQIDDPLPPLGEIDPKVRLHDAVKALNHNQTRRLLRFRGDGTGAGVVWALVPNP